MGRKIYESDKLPLSLTPAQYDNGINEQIIIQEVFEGPVELKDVIDFVRSDNPRTKVTDMNGRKINYFPTRKLKITVDKEKVIANGIVPESMKDQIVDEIVWTISSKTYALYKNDLMLLDFMATNDWERAVYFTSLSDISNVLGIDKYLHQEGPSHRFMPVPAKEYYKGAGGVYIDGSYDLLVNKARWGNLNDPDVTVDPESTRNILFIKQAYMRLAQALVNDGQNEKAIETLDKCLYFFPDEKIPYDIYMAYYPDIYYAAGATEKGDEMVNKMVANAMENLEYYKSLSPRYIEYYSEEIRDELRVINQMLEAVKKAKRFEMRDNIDKLLEDAINDFVSVL